MTGQIAYSLFNLAGMAAAFLVSRRMKVAAYEGLSSEKKTGIYLGLVTGVIIGAKLPVMASYGWTPLYLITGKSIYGALIGAFIGINLVKYCNNMKGSFGDRFIVPLALAVAFGRAGCFVNGCCAGIETDSFLHIPGPGGHPVHPTQLYSLGFQLLMVFFFYFLYRKKIFPGAHFTLYMILYGTFRFFIEFIRNEPKVVLGLSVYQAMALVTLPFFMLLLYKKISQRDRGEVKA